MVGLPDFNTPFLNHYLHMVEDTESPRIFHIWSAIFDIASSLGRRCWLPSGTGDTFPNHYIVIVGTPGTRKSTSVSLAKRVLRASTGVRFAPSDTGSQRQGLLDAFKGDEDSSKEFLGAVELGGRDTGIMSLTQLEEVTNDPDDESAQFIAEADKHALVAMASEFSRVIGINNHTMLDFLGERYDGEDYEYRTRQTRIVLKNTLLNLMACTTPSSINIALPPQAAAHGFLSRFILVYGARKYKEVPWPAAPSEASVMRVKDVLSDVYYKAQGAFTIDSKARTYATELYGYNLEITDSRFGYYNERRFTHLKKLAMCLAAANLRMEIHRSDFEEAHRILRATERGMPDALGEFGMNPLAMLKQEILEQLRANQGPLTLEQIVAMFHRDARSHEISEVMNDLIRMGQVRMNQLKDGRRVMSAVFTKANTEDEMMTLLAEK